MASRNSTLPQNDSYKNVRFSGRFVDTVRSRAADGGCVSRAASFDEARFLARTLASAIGPVASDAALRNVLDHNPETVRIVERDATRGPTFLAYLPLNAHGLAAMRSGTLDRGAPDTRLLTRADEQPVAIYIWCLYSPGAFVPAISALATHFETIAPVSIPVFASAATPHAARLFTALGFARAVDHFPDADPDILVVFRTTEERLRPQPVAAPRTVTRVSRTIEDVMKVFSIRAATYMNEQSCPYEEEFDGNDFCAAHILGEVDGEPAGCIRVRFFGDFVKIERLAVRPEFRSSTLAFRLVRAALDYCRAKGFRKAYGHARHDLVNFWARFGFRVIPGRPTFSFSDVAYVEMEAVVSPADNPMAIGRSPFELIRPEGAWDTPGPLDRSAMRGASRPPLRATRS